MSEARKIRDAFSALYKLQTQSDKFYSAVAKVKSVDETARTCSVEIVGDEYLIDDVQLNVAVDSTAGFVLVPAVGSFVLISFHNKSDARVSMFSELDKVLINCDTIIANDGLNNGLVNVTHLITELSKFDAKFTAICAQIAVLNTSVGLVDSGAAAAAWIPAQPIVTQPFVTAQLEDTKFKH